MTEPQPASLATEPTKSHNVSAADRGDPARRRRSRAGGAASEGQADRPDTVPVVTFWSVLGLLATGIGAVGAIGSWRSARHSNAAATAVARIEQDRRHVELTPQFERSCRATHDGRTMLWLAFTGPPGLDHLDAVTIAIRDDRHDREPIVAGGPTAEEIAQVVWSPYRFVPHVNGADRFGRAVASISLNQGDWTQRALERTTAPVWADRAFWHHQYADRPVRLKIACHGDGGKPWVIPVEIQVEQDDGAQ